MIELAGISTNLPCSNIGIELMKTFKLATVICNTTLALSILCGLAACGGDSSDDETQLGNSYNQNASVSITVTERNSSSVKLAYMLLSGQYPSMLGARMIAWEGLVANGPNIAADVTLSENAASGYIAIPGLTPNSTDYVFGLVSSSNTTAPLATFTLPHGQTAGTSSLNQLDVPYYGTNSVTVNYSVATSILPHTNGLSISFWEGDASTIYFKQPLANIPITSDASSGTVAFQNVKILRGKTYTVALLLSSSSSDIAATTTFNP